MERKSVEQETEKEEKTITKTITVKEMPVRRDLNLEGLPVTEHHIYPEGTTDENGALKSGYVEIGTEESSRLELTPAKLYVAKTILHKVILKSEPEVKHPEDRTIMIAPMPHQPTEPPSCTHSLAPARLQGLTRESGWWMCSASCLITSVTART